MKKGISVLLLFVFILLTGCGSSSPNSAQYACPEFRPLDNPPAFYQLMYMAETDGKVIHYAKGYTLIAKNGNKIGFGYLDANFYGIPYQIQDQALEGYATQQNVEANLEKDFDANPEKLKGMMFFDAAYYVILNDSQSTVYTYCTDITSKYPQYAKGKGVPYSQFITDVLNYKLYDCIKKRIPFVEENLE